MRISDVDATPFDATVSARIAEVRERIDAAVARGGHGQPVTLVAVTKTHGPEAVMAAWRAGVADVGENRVQEAESKMPLVTVPVRWHLIGHLQRNKARNALQFSLVHGLDSDRLAVALDQAAAAAGSTLDVLVQVNVSGESSKSGVAPGELASFAEQVRAYRNLRVMGAMTMAPFDAPETELRAVFAGARACRTQLQQAGHPAPWLSMGMSGDFEIAVEEGATHVRLGTILFGSRT
ncbi:MAG: YggS family pyridoxal phosphate-dependent enzyme [Gemmatimonadaceae bacterium]|nr:YggS family pyridoxal phosphate-dependent enzyme [Gemmatimonadaceae bacterium]MCC6430246.1 YggS family pyridoxal phosphate-dependent enzyme [Gemmatimonadaceae bacterium]